jgi:hypothetical protein
MLRTLASLIMLLPCYAYADDVKICRNYGCTASSKATFNEIQLADAATLFSSDFNSAEGPAALAKAVGLFARYAGEQTPIWRDNTRDDDGSVDGRMDSNDHSKNATAYLKTLKNRGVLTLYRVRPRRVRAATNPHWVVCIVEIRTDQKYAVDSGWFDNGKSAAVVPLEDWLKGTRSHG